MIYLNKITQIGEISILTIPNMYGDFDSSNIINCGGAKQEEYYNVIDCGHAAGVFYLLFFYFFILYNKLK